MKGEPEPDHSHTAESLPEAAPAGILHSARWSAVRLFNTALQPPERCFINTPLQRGGGRRCYEFRNRFNGFSHINKTVETVSDPFGSGITSLKRSVNEMRGRQRAFWHRISKLALATTVVLCCPACTDKPHAKSPPPPVVEVATVTEADVPIHHEWIGVLDGLVNAQIRAQVAGYLLTQSYREGDPIKKGDLLFEIDPRPFKAALDQAKGVLAQAEAKLGKTELDVKRYGPLVKDKAISQEEYDDAVQADLEAKAAVVSAKAQVEQAQVNLDFTRITSPIDGIASIARAQIGDLVGPATGELTTVSTVDPIKVYYNVTEQAYISFTRQFTTENDRYGRLRQLEIDLILTDGTVYPLKGKIYAADRQIGLTTGALRVEALFPNPGYSLRPGEFARVRVKLDVKPKALLVPQRAVSELQGSYQVAVVAADNTIHIQPVRVGERSSNLWVIEEGLHPGERVVVEGIQKIREGMAVTTTNFMAEQFVQSLAAPPMK